MKVKLSSYLLLLLLTAVPEMPAQVYHNCPVTPPGNPYENPMLDKGLADYDVTFYHIDLEVSNTSTYISGSGTIVARLVNPADTFLLELSSLLEISNVVIDSSMHADFLHEGDLVYINLGEQREAGEIISVQVFYSGTAGQNRGFFAGIKNGRDYTNDQLVTFTLSEPMNASDWFPVKEVVSDKADSAWVFLTTDQGLFAGSEGTLEEIADIGGGKHQFRWKTTYKIAYYLLSLSVGDYRDYSFMAPLSAAGDSVLVQNYIYDSDTYYANNKGVIDETADLIHLYSQKLVDYPFKNEKYGHCVAPIGGGMEHQTMTTLSGFSFGLVSHELAHQWFGDYITCGNWRDIWINEGFASYMEYVALENLRSMEDAEEWINQAMALARDKEGTVYVPEEDVEDTWRLFDMSLSYKKGACILHMLRFELDDDSLFFSVLRNYLNQYGGGSATATDFRSVLEETADRDFSCFFDQWYYGYGYPVFSLSWYQLGDTLYVSSIEKGSSLKTTFFMTPFNLKILSETGSKTVRLVQESEETSWQIPVSGHVTDLVFNEKNDILASGIATHKLPLGKIYSLGPNPFSETIYLEFGSAGSERQIEIASLDGKEIRQFVVSDRAVQLPVAGLKDGPYLITISDGESRYSDKLVKITR